MLEVNWDYVKSMAEYAEAEVSNQLNNEVAYVKFYQTDELYMNYLIGFLEEQYKRKVLRYIPTAPYGGTPEHILWIKTRKER